MFLETPLHVPFNVLRTQTLHSSTGNDLDIFASRSTRNGVLGFLLEIAKTACLTAETQKTLFPFVLFLGIVRNREESPGIAGTDGNRLELLGINRNR